MKVRIIGAESIGVRSLATIVETSEAKIFIDPGASLAPRRYGLPPHPIEIERLEKILGKIRRELEDSDIVVITHYHYDHYLPQPGDAELFAGKLLVVKHPLNSINVSQRIRAYRFLRKNGVYEKAKRVIYADSSSLRLGGLNMEFSGPVPHGPEDTKLGSVIMALVEEDGYRLAFASDVQGPISEKTLEILKRWRPNFIILSGPPSYFAGYKMPEEQVNKGFENLFRLLDVPELEILVVDHHLTRDLNYRKKIARHLETAQERGVEMLTAASYMGEEEDLLEARRRELWSGQKS